MKCRDTQNDKRKNDEKEKHIFKLHYHLRSEIKNHAYSQNYVLSGIIVYNASIFLSVRPSLELPQIIAHIPNWYASIFGAFFIIHKAKKKKNEQHFWSAYFDVLFLVEIEFGSPLPGGLHTLYAVRLSFDSLRVKANNIHLNLHTFTGHLKNYYRKRENRECSTHEIYITNRSVEPIWVFKVEKFSVLIGERKIESKKNMLLLTVWL